MRQNLLHLIAAAALASTTLVSVAVMAADDEKPAGDHKRIAASKEQRAAYRKALKEGRKKAAAGDLKGAIESFRQALTAVPDDPAALSELGLAALRLKDYKTAEEATRKSIANAPTPALRGASLYNLGRLLEERGDRPRAIEAYVASLKERPNQTVRERLAGLDAKAAAAADPLAPQAMAGPFPSVEAFCDKVAKPACLKDDPESAFHCGKKPVASGAKPAAPLLALRVFFTSCEFDPKEHYGTETYHLAVQTPAGWWFAPERFRTWTNRHCAEERKIHELAMTDRIPGTPALLLRSSSKGDCSGGGSMSEWEREELVVSGIGPSGKPSATPAILIKQKQHDEELTDDGDNGKGKDANAALKLDFLPGGQIEISGDARGLDPAQRGLLLGKHPLSFP